MSSLRRRAIWVQRAMSTERSSIGGRASARTTAPRRTGRRAAAATRARRGSRRAGRRRPRRRAGAAPRAPRARPRPPGPRRRSTGTSTATAPGRDTLARDQPLDVGGDRLRLRAIVRAAPEAHLAAVASQARTSPCRAPRTPPRRRAPSSDATGSSLTTRVCGVWNAAIVAAPAPRKRRSVCAGSPAAVSPPPPPSARRGSPPRDRAPGRRRSAGARSGARDVGVLARHPQRIAHEIALVASAGVGEHPLVGAVDLGELDARAPPRASPASAWRSPPSAA